MIVPFVNGQKYAASASAGASMQQRINSTNGSTLLRPYFRIFINGEKDLNAYTHSDAAILSYNTVMDGLRLQDYTLAVADGTAWLTNERNFNN